MYNHNTVIPIRDFRHTRSFPVITIALILINLLVFLYQGYLGTQEPVLNDGIAWQQQDLPLPGFDPNSYNAHRLSGGSPRLYPMSGNNYFITKYALVPWEFVSRVDLPPTLSIPIWLTLFTSIFIHGGLLHLLGNMLYLWVFGDNVEDAMGHTRFLVFYLLCGALASLIQMVTSLGSGVPVIGASGAIAGILAAYFMLFPDSKVLTIIPIFFFIRVIALPAVFLLGFWFILQLFQGASSLGAASGVAWFAHIGGFVAGAILVFIFKKRGIPVTLWQRLRSRV